MIYSPHKKEFLVMFPFNFLELKRNGRYSLFNPVNNTEYELNLLAYRILEQCSGLRTVNDIAENIEKEFFLNHSEAHEWVYGFLEDMYNEGIVSWRKHKIDDEKPALPPSQVFWDITGSCNLSCLHCYNKESLNAAADVPRSIVLRVVEELANFGVENLSFSGGEPLLRRDFISIAKHASNLGLRVSVATNGLLVTRRSALVFKNSGIHVQVSIDGDTANVHDKIRGKGAFEKAVNGIRVLVDVGVNVSVCTTLNSINIDRVPYIIEFVDQLGVDSLRAQGVVRMGRCGDNYRKLALPPARMKTVVEYLEKRGIPISSYNFTLQPPPGEKIELSGSGACSAATDSCSITAEGKVVPCTYFWGLKAENIREHSFPWIWENSPILRYFRSIQLEEIHGFCRDCSWLSLCHGGCKAENYVRGDIFASRSSCWVLDEQGRNEQKVSSKGG